MPVSHTRPRTHAPHHEGGKPKAEDLIRQAHRLLDIAGVSLSHTKVARICRAYSRTDAQGALAWFLAEELDLQRAQLERLMQHANTGHPRAAKGWTEKAGQSGAWPIRAN